MIYLENILVCLAVPLLIAALLLRGETRRFLVFFTLGLFICLLCAYINSYIAAALSQNGIASLGLPQVMVQITPICEESMKALPVLLFMAAWRPSGRELVAVALAVGLGFATFENCCYLTEYGAPDALFAIIRGFSTGALHAICAAILGFGLAFLLHRGRLVVPGAFALLCLVTTFHAIYNMLVASGGAWRALGYAFPLVSAVFLLTFIRLHRGLALAR